MFHFIFFSLIILVNIFIHLCLNFFEDHDIIHESSCPHTPQQNGVVERKMRHLLEVTCALMFHMRVPKSYWSDVVLIAYHLINHVPSTVLGGQIPYIMLSPNAHLFHLPPKIFGCVCYVHILGDKLDPRSIKCVFLGILIVKRDTDVTHLLIIIISLVLM